MAKAVFRPGEAKTIEEKVYDDVNVLLSVEKGDLVYGIYEDDTEETVELYKNDDAINRGYYDSNVAYIAKWSTPKMWE